MEKNLLRGIKFYGIDKNKALEDSEQKQDETSDFSKDQEKSPGG